MAACRHIGFSVFLNISETVAPRAKRMKIWAHRVKVNHDILSMCITNNMKVHPRWPLATGHIGFSVFLNISETVARIAKWS